MHQHMMSFHWDSSVGPFLFPGLDINGVSSLVLLCAVLFALGLAYEAVKVLLTKSKQRTARERMRPPSVSTETTILLSATNRSSNQNNNVNRKFANVLGQAGIFIFENIISYLFMLVVMVYNGYVFVAVVIGMGFGYFFFGHIAMKINMENIRARTTNSMHPVKSTPAVTGCSDGDSTQGAVPANFNENVCFEPSSNSQIEVDIHTCVGAQETETLHTCRL